MTREGIKMTNDEAKSVLFNMLGKGIYVKDTKENQAILVALRALEQEPCEDWYDVPSDEMTLGQARQAVKDLRKMWAEHLEQAPCNDVISRQAVLDKAVYTETEEGWCGRTVDVKDIESLPPVTPQPKTGHCKDCIWWKDSDGVYRRGIEAESLCPINTNVVYFGDGYCYMYEPQGSEVEE